LSLEEVVSFDWNCPKCWEHGYVEDQQVYRYCPYCGAAVTVKVFTPQEEELEDEEKEVIENEPRRGEEGREQVS